MTLHINGYNSTDYRIRQLFLGLPAIEEYQIEPLINHPRVSALHLTNI